MKEKKVKVSAVSYLNTLPFLHGINHAAVKDKMDLVLDIPSVCARKLLDDDVDLGLVPIAILPEMSEYYIVSDFCIGAEGKVDSVALFSDVPLNEVENIYLDYQSKTSINLVQFLAEKHWNISPNWLNAERGFEDEIKETTAGVIIGDRTFNLPKTYLYKYDLAEEWLKCTGLPFVFACWVSNKKLSDEFIVQFNSALRKGIESINEVVLAARKTNVTKEKLHDYLSEKIAYNLDANKRKAIEEFLTYMKTRKALCSDS